MGILQFDEEIQSQMKQIAEGVTNTVVEGITNIDEVFKEKTQETNYKVFGDEGNKFIEFFNIKFNEILNADKEESIDPEIVILTANILGSEELKDEAKSFSDKLVNDTIDAFDFSFDEIDVSNLRSIKLDKDKDFEEIANKISKIVEDVLNYLDDETKKVGELSEENPYFGTLQTLIEIITNVVIQGLTNLDKRIFELGNMVSEKIDSTVSHSNDEREGKINEIRAKAESIRNDLYEEIDSLFGDLEI